MPSMRSLAPRAFYPHLHGMGMLTRCRSVASLVRAVVSPPGYIQVAAISPLASFDGMFPSFDTYRS